MTARMVHGVGVVLLLGPPPPGLPFGSGRWLGVSLPLRTQQGFQRGRGAGRLGGPTTSSSFRGCPRAATLPLPLSLHGIASLQQVLQLTLYQMSVPSHGLESPAGQVDTGQWRQLLVQQVEAPSQWALPGRHSLSLHKLNQ